MTIYDDAVEAGQNASRAVVEAALASREAQAATYKSERDEANLKVADLTKKLADATSANTTLTQNLATAKSTIDALNAEIERLKGTTQPTPTPDPQPPAELFPFGVGIDKLGTVETAAGTPAVYHRTYHTMPSATGVPTSLVTAVEADLKAGRIPIVSVKLPGSAADGAGVRAGKYDVGFKAIRDKLASYKKPIVLAVHHEPEDDWDLEDFKTATAYMAPKLKSEFVEFWVCFMGYHQLYGTSVWKLDKVLIPGVDGYGFDPYLSFGASSTKWTDQVTQYYNKFGAWAKANNVKWGIWETGINEQAITSGKPEAAVWFEHCVSGAKAAGATMWTYFNSETTVDGKHDWRLSTTGANKFNQFVAVLKKFKPAA